MDFATPLGIIFGFGMLLAAFVMEGGHLLALVGLTASMIVFGGTICATMTSFTLKEVLSIPRILVYASTMSMANVQRLREAIELMVYFSEKARREGILGLETEIQEKLTDGKWDPILKKGIRLIVDGTEPAIVTEIMENDIYITEQNRKREQSVFEAAGGYSPTMGIIGTVMGLVHVLANLSDPSQLGPAVALAFVATLYGVSFANLFWLPVAGKLKYKLKQEIIQKQLFIAGILAIQAGENPRIVRDKLEIFLAQNERESAGETGEK